MARDFKHLLVSYLHDQQLQKLAARYLNGRVIDIGCGSKPYKSMLQKYVSQHIGIDRRGRERRSEDVISSAYSMPFREGAFDCAVCTSVLEHLEEPEEALRECFRVLRQSGVAVYSVPFIWHIHEAPRDFYRFSKFGLEHLFTKVGFEILELNAISGFWGTFGQLSVYNLYRLHRGPLKYIPIIPVLGLIIQALSLLLDRLDKSEAWTCLYMIAARKPK